MTPDSTMRLRFAPSPTGYLHVGGARTALFNWLLARKHDGVFVLRIEDTDRQRSSEEMVEAILDGLRWLGLEWDEGPFHQADGFERHRADVARLLESGAAYRCFCTPEALEERRRQAGTSADAFRYDRWCCENLAPDEEERRVAAGEPHVVRFRVPAGATEWHDAVHGFLEFANSSIEDFVILRSDGTPIYNMAVVSDDIDMRITHVVRGDDHISNTPKQILLYQALGASVPTFAHLPMILGPDGKRLSKRHGATAVGEYRERGFLPSAMTNFLALLGWNPGTEEEIFALAELVDRFSLEQVNLKSAVFDTQKLEWMNGKHINRLSTSELAPLITARLIEQGAADEALLEDRHDWLLGAIELLKPRARNLDDIARHAVVYLGGPVTYEPEAVEKHWADAEATLRQLTAVREVLVGVEAWEPEALEPALRGLAEQLGITAGKLFHPLRVALTGTAVSPGIFEVLAVLGRDVAIERVDRALDVLWGNVTAGEPGSASA